MNNIRGMVVLPPGLQLLIDLLRERGWTVVGPTVRDGVIVHAEIESLDQLPRGVGDLQDGAATGSVSAVTTRCSALSSVPRAGSHCCSPHTSCCGADDGPARMWTSSRLTSMRPT